MLKVILFKSLARNNKVNEAKRMIEKELVENPEFFFFNYLFGKLVVKHENEEKWTNAEIALENAINICNSVIQVKCCFYLAKVKLIRGDFKSFFQLYQISRNFYKKEKKMEEAYKKHRENIQMLITKERAAS